MKKFEIFKTKNEDNSSEKMFWLHVDDEILNKILLGIINALIEELDDRHE